MKDNEQLTKEVEELRKRIRWREYRDILSPRPGIGVIEFIGMIGFGVMLFLYVFK